MAVFVAASDETDCGTDHRGTFFHCGFLAPEQDWYNIFIPLWKMRVLKGPPLIPHFHMTDMKSKYWCKDNGIDLGEADFRIDEAFGVITAMPSLYPIACEFNAGHVLDVFQRKMQFKTGAIRRFEPDYLAFIGYVDKVLEVVEENYSEAEKVDFVVEAKGETTKRIMEFYDKLPNNLVTLGHPRRGQLMGAFIPAKKDSVPVHAADLLCWYTRRAYEQSLEARDIKRYSKIATRIGARLKLSNEEIETLYAMCLEGQDEKT
jgi:hypothetical protein